MVDVLHSRVVKVDVPFDPFEKGRSYRYKLYTSNPKNVLVSRYYDIADTYRHIHCHDWKCDICLVYQVKTADGRYVTFMREYFPFKGVKQISINF